MERWVIYAVVSMLFAGCTSVVAKQGLAGISGELGLVVRTCFVFGFVLILGWLIVPSADWSKLDGKHYYWLGLSGVTTAGSWIFYYKALQAGDVMTVALIDKGSFIIAVLLAWLFLGEQFTWRVGLGSLLILAGLLIVSYRPKSASVSPVAVTSVSAVSAVSKPAQN